MVKKLRKKLFIKNQHVNNVKENYIFNNIMLWSIFF